MSKAQVMLKSCFSADYGCLVPAGTTVGVESEPGKTHVQRSEVMLKSCFTADCGGRAPVGTSVDVVEGA